MPNPSVALFRVDFSVESRRIVAPLSCSLQRWQIGFSCSDIFVAMSFQSGMSSEINHNGIVAVGRGAWNIDGMSSACLETYC